MESFFSKNESCKRKRNARRVHNASRVKVPFLSLCFLAVYFPLLRAVLLERLLDRGDRSSLLQREDVFFGRFPVVILLRHCVSLFFKPPLLYSSKAQQKQNEKKKDGRRHFSCRMSESLLAKRVCVFVCVRLRAWYQGNAMMNEFWGGKRSNFLFSFPPMRSGVV